MGCSSGANWLYRDPAGSVWHRNEPGVWKWRDNGVRRESCFWERFPLLNELLDLWLLGLSGPSFSLRTQRCPGLTLLCPYCPFHELWHFLSRVYFHFSPGSCPQQLACIWNHLLLTWEFTRGEKGRKITIPGDTTSSGIWKESQHWRCAPFFRLKETKDSGRPWNTLRKGTESSSQCLGWGWGWRVPTAIPLGLLKSSWVHKGTEPQPIVTLPVTSAPEFSL